MTNLICKACGETFHRALLFALMIEFGAKTNDPNYCRDSEDHEHIWIDNDSQEKLQKDQVKQATAIQEEAVTP